MAEEDKQLPRAWHATEAQQDDIDYLKEMLTSSPNVVGLSTALVVAAALSIPFGVGMAAIPVVGAIAAEAIMALFIPSSPVFRAHINRRNKQKRRDEARAHLTEDLSPVLLEKIRGGAIDCAVLALPYPTGDLHVSELFADRLLVAFGRTANLSAKAKGVTSATLRTENLLLLNDGHCLKDQALAACKFNSADVTVSFEAAGLMTLMGMVDRGLGVTFVPELAVRSIRKCFPKIGYAALAESGAFRTIALCWRKGSHRQADFEIVADMIRDLNPLAGARR